METSKHSRARWVGLLLLPVAAILFAACGDTEVAPTKPLPPNVKCAASDLGCRCASPDIEIAPGETAVDSCDDVLGRTCCYDVSAAGETSQCECETATCTGNTHYCTCTWNSGATSSNATTDLAGCTPTGYAGTPFASPGVCCVYFANNGSGLLSRTCRCDESKSTCDNGYEVDSCEGSMRDCTNFGIDGLAGQGPANTCNDVMWVTQ